MRQGIAGTIVFVFFFLALGSAAPRLAVAATPTPPYTASWEIFRVGQGADQAPTGHLALLWIKPDPGVYAYSHTPGAMGQPTTLKATRTDGGAAPTMRYAPGIQKPDTSDPTILVNVYDGPTPVFVELGEPEPSAGVRSIALQAELRMLLCTDRSCWPVTARVDTSWTISELEKLPEARNQLWWPSYLAAGGQRVSADPKTALTPIVARAPAPAPIASTVAGLSVTPRYFQPGLEVNDLLKAMIFGFLAGLILNFMPCVLPVISLKLSALVTASGIADERRRTQVFRTHNIFFALGILSYFLALGLFLGLAGMAWGQIFQKPEVILGLTALIFPLGLSLFGLFDLPIVDLKAGSDLTDKPRTQALFTGFLATLLATPCSGPLLGGVLGWTLDQKSAVIIGVFFWIGLGMATPYLLLALVPKLVRFFPKPGRWNLHLERLVGFFLMATCIYLLGILPAHYLLPGLVLLWVTAFGAWMWGHWTSLGRSRLHRLTVRAAAVLLVAVAVLFILRAPSAEAEWSSFDEQQFLSDLGRENLLIDFTADWCPNCKVLEKTTLSSKNLAAWTKRYKLKLLQADLTRENPAAQALLRKLGSQSIPVVAIFPANHGQSLQPLVLRDLFTTGQMDQALASLFAKP